MQFSIKKFFACSSKLRLQRQDGHPMVTLPEELLLCFRLHVQDTLGEPAEHQVPVHLHHAVRQVYPSLEFKKNK
jgi:hypothetical protein